MDGQIRDVRKDLASVIAEVRDVKKELSWVKAEIRDVKKELSWVKADVKKLKSDFSNFLLEFQDRGQNQSRGDNNAVISSSPQTGLSAEEDASGTLSYRTAEAKTSAICFYNSSQTALMDVDANELDYEPFQEEINSKYDSEGPIQLEIPTVQRKCGLQEPEVDEVNIVGYYIKAEDIDQDLARNESQSTHPNGSPGPSGQPRRTVKSAVSLICNNLLHASDSESDSSVSVLPNDSFGYNQWNNERCIHDLSMPDRFNDVTLGRLKSRKTSKPYSRPCNSEVSSLCKTRISNSYPPNYEASHKRKVQHQQSFTFRNRSSTADVIPNLPMRRTKRIRPSYYVPSYDIDSFRLIFSVGVIDSHCHLNFLFARESYRGSFANYRLKYHEQFADCFEGCITVFCEPEKFSASCNDPVFHENGVWAVFGCHPHTVNGYNDETEKALLKAVQDPKVLAFGEIGLDYSKRNNCDWELQRRVFRRQLRLAVRHNLPVVIHCREAHDDCIEIVKEALPRDFLIHLQCFKDTWERAEEWLNAFPNLYIGITGIVTFLSAENVHEIALKIPLDRLLFETDTPYFVPETISARWTHPGMVIHAAAQIAAFRTETSLEDLLRAVRHNTYKIYKI